jgi:hypothetical protein
MKVARTTGRESKVGLKEEAEKIEQDGLWPVEVVPVSSLKPHPRNYQEHPDDQLEHLMTSIRESGIYRNIVVARDGTVLAGHGVMEAVRRLGLETVPVHRVDVEPDSAAALKILTGDNEISHLAAVDDRALTEILREIAQSEAGLVGTGYDEAMLANLVMVTRPRSEIQDANEAAQWVGMPQYDAEAASPTMKLIVNFETEEAREKFLEEIGTPVMSKKDGQTWSMWWPPRERHDLASVRFETGGDGEEEGGEDDVE